MGVRKLFCSLIFICGAFASFCSAAEPNAVRLWTTVKGKKLEAAFQMVSEGRVVLESTAGKKVQIKPEALSMVDRLILKEWGEVEGPATLRRWTSQGGKSVVGSIKGYEDNLVVFDLGNREVRLLKSKLSDEDQARVDALQAAEAERLEADRNARREAMMNTPYGPYKPGRLATFTMPVREEVSALMKKEKVDPFDEIKLGIALPENFDPDLVYPIIIAQITGSTKNGTCYSAAGKYRQVGIEEGCIVMGVSAPEKLSSEPYVYRNAMAEEGLRVLYESMPQAKAWPIYFAGFSGGAKYSGSLAGMMAKNGYPIAGVFMAGCNEDMISWGYKEYHPPKTFKKVALYLSNGDKDKIASYKTYGKYLKGLMKGSGFKNVRSEVFDGTHEVSQEHFREALQWFKTFQDADENS